ncbi:unnamed protein product [Owenia fusiformis]|uniref:Uncharacterized protein n=1 Tax=Owenia fusiformis TaxID=6347 RepID=A0A8J1UGI3_OWEFU|nr:unnamed protein product [Owenia fusiformis]
MNFNQVKQKYDITGNNFLYLHGIIQGIPQEWKRNIQVENPHNQNLYERYLDSGSQNSFMYHQFTKSVKCKPDKTQAKWIEKLDNNIDINWKQVYLLTKTITNNVRLQCFQYKMLHRALYFNNLLVKMHKKQSSLCDICKQDKDSIEHAFIYCNDTKLL